MSPEANFLQPSSAQSLHHVPQDSVARWVAWRLDANPAPAGTRGERMAPSPKGDTSGPACLGVTSAQ